MPIEGFYLETVSPIKQPREFPLEEVIAKMGNVSIEQGNLGETVLHVSHGALGNSYYHLDDNHKHPVVLSPELSGKSI